MNAQLGVGLALLFVGAFHLLPAYLDGAIPRTLGKPLSREGEPTEFWVAVSVFAGSALAGLILILVWLLP